jgi:hypothetical protein
MFDFYWLVPEAGYEWIAARPANPKSPRSDADSNYLCCRNPTDELIRYRTGSPVLNQATTMASPFRAYAPFLDEPALFKKFSELDPTKEAIERFATNYGDLGAELGEAIKRPVPGKPNTYQQVTAISQRTWKREITTLQHGVRLWEAIKSSDIQFLKSFFKWQRSEENLATVRYEGPTMRTSLSASSLGLDSETRARLVVGDLIFPAHLVLSELIDQNVARFRIPSKLVWSYTGGKMVASSRFVPKSLAAALWIQFQKAVVAVPDFTQCEVCREWMEVSGDKRVDARFCSNACRFRAYRRRQKDARELHAAGESEQDIAKKLGSDPATIRRWIANGE